MQILSTGQGKYLSLQAPRISQERVMLFAQNFGLKMVPLAPGTGRIYFRNMRFRLPAGSDLLITSEINAEKIFYCPNKERLVFYRKVITPHRVEFENIGEIRFDEQGFLLQGNERFVTPGGKMPNCREGKQYSLNLADAVEIFGIRERTVTLAPSTGWAVIKLFTISCRLSTDPHNLYYDDLAGGRIRYQVWPQGRAVFFRRIGNRDTYLGEVTRQMLFENMQAKGRTFVYLPDLINELSGREAPINQRYQHPGESPCYGFTSSGIMYSFHVFEEMTYAGSILRGDLYRREYNDRIEIGLKIDGIFSVLGEFTFDPEGRIIKDGKVFLHQGKAVIKKDKPRYYVHLKALVPELASITKPFRYAENQRSDGNSYPECRADAQGHFYLLSANPRNPISRLTKEGKVNLCLFPQKIFVFVNGRLLGPVRKDTEGNIYNADGSIAVPAHIKRVNLLPQIPELDVEEGRFTYITRKSGNKDSVQLRTRGLRFVALVNREWFMARWLKAGDVYWRREGKKIEIRRKRQVSALAYFEVDTETMEIRSEGGRTIPFPESKRINLAELTPTFDLEDKGFLHFLRSHSHGRTGEFVSREDIRFLAAFIEKTEVSGLNFDNEVFMSRFYFALNLFMGRLVRNENQIEDRERIRNFLIALRLFFNAADIHLKKRSYVNGFVDILELHTEDIGNYLIDLIERFGKRKVLLTLKQIENGTLDSRVHSLIHAFEEV